MELREKRELSSLASLFRFDDFGRKFRVDWDISVTMTSMWGFGFRSVSRGCLREVLQWKCDGEGNSVLWFLFTILIRPEVCTMIGFWSFLSFEGSKQERPVVGWLLIYSGLIMIFIVEVLITLSDLELVCSEALREQCQEPLATNCSPVILM